MVLLTACFGIAVPKIGKSEYECEYVRLGDDKDEEADKMMENTVGLEDGKCYKFRNRADNTVNLFWSRCTISFSNQQWHQSLTKFNFKSQG